MDGWMDGWMYGWMDGWMVYVCLYVCLYGGYLGMLVVPLLTLNIDTPILKKKGL